MTHIKICGVTRVRDVEMAVDAGADSIGINLFPGSPRFVPDESVQQLVNAVPPLVEAVGVVVELGEEWLREKAKQFGFPTMQFHGRYPPIMRDQEVRLIPAIQIRRSGDLNFVKSDAKLAANAGNPWKAMLVDAYVKGLHGGTGQTARWDLLENFDPGVPWILAGGLTPYNVAEAIRRLRPWAVDVCSGVESAPGIKDIMKIRDFVAAVRAVQGENNTTRLTP